MKNSLAPIALFTYRRIDTLSKTIESLLKASLCSESELYIFSDGAKSATDIDSVELVRQYLKTIAGFKKIEIFISEKNQGLATSIISGVTKVLKTHETVIVMEDDLIVTSNFLTFMNQALIRYKDYNRAFSISGYSFDLKPSSVNNDAYFLNRGWSWGWATWKDRWEDVDWTVKDYEQFRRNPKLQKLFNKGGSDLTQMLDKQMTNKLDSWAIRWFYHQFKNNGLTLYPTTSKVLNDGFDSRATHTTGSNTRYLPKMDMALKNNFIFPEVVEVNYHYQREFQKKMNLLSRIKSKIVSIFIRLLRGR